MTDTSGRSHGRGASRDSSFLPLSHETRSRSSDASQSTGYTESDAISEGISESTAWGISTSRAAGDSESQARTMQRSREFVVEQHELQQLPPSAMIVTYAGAGGRQVVAVDANPGIMSLPTATLASLEEARRVPPGNLGPAPAAAARACSPDSPEPPPEPCASRASGVGPGRAPAAPGRA